MRLLFKTKHGLTEISEKDVPRQNRATKGKRLLSAPAKMAPHVFVQLLPGQEITISCDVCGAKRTAKGMKRVFYTCKACVKK